MVAHRSSRRHTAAFTIVVCCAFVLHAQKPGSARRTDWAASNDWPVYHGSSANIKYSTLVQVTPANVRNLREVWRYSSTQASDTNTTDMKTNPLIIDGTLYGLNPQLKLFALDAATGKVKWVYDSVIVPQKGKNIGRGDFAGSTKISRGIALYHGSPTDQRILYAPGGGHALYCVNALTGKLKRASPALRNAGVRIDWPTRHGDEKIIKAAIAPKSRRQRSSRSSSSPNQPNDLIA